MSTPPYDLLRSMVDFTFFIFTVRNPPFHFGRICFVVLEKEGRAKKKVKEADLYSTFIEVPYTQGAQVQIKQCYLQTTPYLPLPRKHSPDGASQTEVADI